MKEKFYLTTAIAYTSGKPHIGNTYEVVLADAIARYKRMRGFDVFFMTGTDEHGQKVEMKAKDKGVTPKQFVDSVAGEIKSIWDGMNATYDKFIRTTDSYHEEQVKKIFNKFYQAGDIYKGSYQGMYCTPCESFWTESQLVEGKCPDCGRECKPAQEEAYFFKMGKYAQRLVKHIVTNPEFIVPASRKKEMLNNFLLADEYIGKTDSELLEIIERGELKTKLQDLCVSRTTFTWGIPVDFDSKHVVYVWLDALTNYITGIGYDVDNPSELYNKLWPADLQVIGKDIVRFHTIYWPIFLMALDIPLPKKILGHPWLLQGGDKMSKSKGNVLYADDLASVFGVDCVRYFVLHEMPFENDGTITWELMCEKNNSDLANTLGNLVKRTISMTNQYFGGTVVNTNVVEPIDDDFKQTVLSSVQKTMDKMDEYKVAEAMDALWTVFRRANKYIDETTPWVLFKDEQNRGRLSTVLYNLLEAIVMGANLLFAFMPATAKEILEETGGSVRDTTELAIFALPNEYNVTNAPKTLFERIKMSDIQPKIDQIQALQLAEVKEQVEEEQIPLCTIDDFCKVRMVVGTVVACEPVKKSKLLHETISIGNGKKISVLSGIAKHYTAEEMVGKRVVVVTNLPPREMKGIMSEGMVVCASSNDGELSIVTPEKNLPDGSVLS